MNRLQMIVQSGDAVVMRECAPSVWTLLSSPSGIKSGSVLIIHSPIWDNFVSVRTPSVSSQTNWILMMRKEAIALWTR